MVGFIGDKCWLCGGKVKNLMDHLKKKHLLSNKDAELTVQNFFLCSEAELQLNAKLSNGQETNIIPSIRITLNSPNQKPASRKNSSSVLERVSKKRVRFDDRSIAIRKYSTN